MKGLFSGAAVGMVAIVVLTGVTAPWEFPARAARAARVVVANPAPGLMFDWWDVSCMFIGPIAPWCPMPIKDPVVPEVAPVYPDWCSDVYGPCQFQGPGPVT